MGFKIEGEESATLSSASDDSEKTKMLRGQAFKGKLAEIHQPSVSLRKKESPLNPHLCKVFITLFILTQRVRVSLQCRSRRSTAFSWSPYAAACNAFL